MISDVGYIPQGNENRALYLRDLLDNVGSGVGHLSLFYHINGFSDVSIDKLGRDRVRFLGTLSRVELFEQEFEALTGTPHCSYCFIKKRLNDLIERSSCQIAYKNAQRINLN